jgi:hypothetical protein
VRGDLLQVARHGEEERGRDLVERLGERLDVFRIVRHHVGEQRERDRRVAAHHVAQRQERHGAM